MVYFSVVSEISALFKPIFRVEDAHMPPWITRRDAADYISTTCEEFTSFFFFIIQLVFKSDNF